MGWREEVTTVEKNLRLYITTMDKDLKDGAALASNLPNAFDPTLKTIEQTCCQFRGRGLENGSVSGGAPLPRQH